MMSSPTTMNDDVMLEIMSYCPATEMAKLRLLNKECNKRSYELSFINRHLHRTNSFFGYLLHCRDGWFNRSCLVSGVDEKEKIQINLAFLPPRHYKAKIEACDTHHGILLCIDDVYKGPTRIPDYIVCKPATKQYRIIPNPKTRFDTLATGLMVVSSNPFRYKIIRVSSTRARRTRDDVYSLSCEVFDSDSDAWKRLNYLETSDLFRREVKPVSAYGCLHWLTEKDNVRRFCVRTETWSIFPVPDDLRCDNTDEFRCYNTLVLVSYEGKLGVIHSKWGEGSDIWVLEKSFGTSWVRVKDAKIAAVDDNESAPPIWFPSKDTVSRASSRGLRLYSMSNNNNYGCLRTEEDCLVTLGFDRDRLIPFYSNYDRVCLHKDDDEKERSERRRSDEPIENKECEEKLKKSGTTRNLSYWGQQNLLKFTKGTFITILFVACILKLLLCF